MEGNLLISVYLTKVVSILDSEFVCEFLLEEVHGG